VIVVLAAEAEADLEHIAAYVAEQSPRSALNLVRELREKCESLLDAPRGYPLVPRYEHLGIRRRPFGNFLGERVSLIQSDGWCRQTIGAQERTRTFTACTTGT
jgi:plasmid stabilization system protein ParE